MDTRVKNFLSIKLVGQLQAWKRWPPSRISGEVESGLLYAKQLPPINIKSQHSPGCERCRGTPESLADESMYPQTTSLPSTRVTMLKPHQQPHFTEGPARFVVVNDGSAECLALLVTKAFVAKTCDLYEDSHHLLGKQGPLQQVRRDARDLQVSASLVKESLGVAQSQEEADELEKIAHSLENELIEARRRKNEIEKGAELLESSVAASRAYTQWVLETAMEEANLLEPHRPLTPFTAADTKYDEDLNESWNRRQLNNSTEHANGDNDVQNAIIPTQQTVLLTCDVEGSASLDEASVNNDDDSIRLVAWEDYNEKFAIFHEVQAIFDERQQAYETNLAKFQDGVKTGIYTMSRSEFDRNRIQHGQKITRALIDAEEAFDAAKAYAQAVGAIGSDYEQSSYFDNCGERMSESQIVSHDASRDFNHIYTWLANVPETGGPNDFELVEIDDWDAKEVDQTDSISQIDCEEYRKPIDQWQYECALTRGDGAEEYYLGPVNIEFLERRHSVSC